MIKMRHIIFIAATAMAFFSMVSCNLDNDTRYPDVPTDITVFEVKGQKSSTIDPNNLSVTVDLPEEANTESLEIARFKFTEGAQCKTPGMEAGSKIDLSKDMHVVLYRYKEYVWTISATQKVERYVHCERQVGDAVIIPSEKKINLTVTPDKTSYIDVRTKLEITDMKLGRTGSKVISTTDNKGVTTKIESFPVILDCFYQRTFTVEEDGKTYDWKMIVLTSED